ncbi:MAG TPA: hypothetical protein VHG53_00260 [Candidatus Limnocylindria bacterium]|nr:hypothetical protein [Candidatus Limnocylindria bacterium]
MTARAARGGWVAYGVVAAALAAVALLAWLRALVLDGPVLYGEGAVAHAALLGRTLAEYSDPAGPQFVAANYPPLFFAIAGVGDPFITGRVVSITATLGIAVLLFLRARGADRVVRAALALGWLALAPVSIWGAAVKPDLLALVLTVGAVWSLESRRAAASAALLVVAALAKPTALVPALALLLWVVLRDRALLRAFIFGGAAASAIAVVALDAFGYADVWRHVVTWNALAWTAEPAILLAFLGLAVYGAALAAGVLTRSFGGPIGAYAAGAIVVVLLGGRDGATINYLLDLAAAACLAVAAAAPRLARSPAYPLAAIVTLAIGLLIFSPFGVVPGRPTTTGAWGDPARLGAVRDALASDAVVLAEDSGLLVATGHDVVIDDLFLWSRLVARGTVDPAPLLGEVRAGRFTAIVSEVELAKLAAAPAYERARWDPALAQAIGERYRFDRRLAGGLFVYRPR